MENAIEKDRLARAVAEQMRAREGTATAWRHRIEEAGDGYARVSMTATQAMMNGHGQVHGGMIFALADTAFAYACNSRNEKTVAQSASISFLSPGGLGEKLTAEAREAGTAGRSGVFSVIVTGEDQRVVALFHGLSRTLGGPVIDAPASGASSGRAQ